MTVYADVLAVTNLYVDFFLLWCVRRSLHLRVRNRRLALGAAVGAACSLVCLLPQQPWLFFGVGVLRVDSGIRAFLCLGLFLSPGRIFPVPHPLVCPTEPGGGGARGVPGPVPPAAVPVHGSSLSGAVALSKAVPPGGPVPSIPPVPGGAKAKREVCRFWSRPVGLGRRSLPAWPACAPGPGAPGWCPLTSRNGCCALNRLAGRAAVASPGGVGQRFAAGETSTILSFQSSSPRSCV